jgi:hypothetical protein
VVELMEELVGRWYLSDNARRQMKVEWLQLVQDRGRLEGYHELRRYRWQVLQFDHSLFYHSIPSPAFFVKTTPLGL